MCLRGTQEMHSRGNTPHPLLTPSPAPSVLKQGDPPGGLTAHTPPTCPARTKPLLRYHCGHWVSLHLDSVQGSRFRWSYTSFFPLKSSCTWEVLVGWWGRVSPLWGGWDREPLEMAEGTAFQRLICYWGAFRGEISGCCYLL